MNFSIKLFVATNGERFALLFENRTSDLFPHFYSTAFIAGSIRSNTTQGTQLVYLEAIKRIYECAAVEGYCIEDRFQKSDFLRPHEIETMCIYLRKARRNTANTGISAGKGNTYIAYALRYLAWLATKLVTDANTSHVLSAIENQKICFEDFIVRKIGSKQEQKQRILALQLSECARKQLLSLFQNPFQSVSQRSDRGIRLRNVVMMRILYETGMRRGELLSLKIKNYLESAGRPHASLIIERNHHDEFDTRLNQPVAKTAGRHVPICDETEIQLMEYLTRYRAEVPNVGFSDEDFIFVSHRMGAQQGAAISISNFNQAFLSLRNQFSILSNVHPHLLRHDWNFRFSVKSDELKLSEAKEWKQRSLLMGWSFKSEMSQVYNQRHLQEQSNATGLLIANDTKKKL
jgi:integrase